MKISIANVFTPATEIDDIKRFAGRNDELQRLAWALQSEGVQIVIYGNRGIGKSSLARQLEKLALSDNNVMARLRTKPDDPFDYLPIYFRCDDSISDIPRLLLRLLSDDTALASWVPFKVVSVDKKNELGAKLNIKIMSIEGKGATSICEAAQELETDIVSVFNNALTSIAKAGVAKDGILLIIDEFDRIRDRTGIASLMKTLGPQHVRFALVGVATTIQELITDHESVARQLADGAVHVPSMTDSEIYEILDRAEALLENKFKFLLDARTWIVTIAKGHPFLVHLVGKHALIKAAEGCSSEVTQPICEEALQDIALKGSAPIQETLYKTAIGHSHVREYILKKFAAQSEEEVHTTDLYSAMAKDLGIDPSAISVYVGQLGTEKYGAVIEKTRDRYYRFRDSLFKAYAAIRPWQLTKGEQDEE